MYVFGNRLFYFETITERKVKNKKNGGKKKFLLSMYVFCVCVFVCLCVGLSVDTLHASSFIIGG